MTHEIVMPTERASMAAAQDVRKLLRHRGRTVVALALAAIVTLLGVRARPNPPALSMLVTGDAALAARARPLLHGHLDRVSIAVVDGATVSYAGFGANEHTEYEIGSLTKTFTAMLLADAIRRGELTADTQVGALLPLGGVRSTPVDLVAYVRALLDGTAPGIDALTPRWEVGAQHIGYAWMTQDYEGHTLTVTNGLTGGFISKIILDRAQQRAVIVLSNTATPVDDVA